MRKQQHETHNHTTTFFAIIIYIFASPFVSLDFLTAILKDTLCEKREGEREREMSSGKVTQWKTVTKTEIVDGKRKVTTIRTRTTTKTQRSDGITIAGKPRNVYKQNDHSIFAQFSGKKKKTKKKNKKTFKERQEEKLAASNEKLKQRKEEERQREEREASERQLAAKERQRRKLEELLQ